MQHMLTHGATFAPYMRDQGSRMVHANAILISCRAKTLFTPHHSCALSGQTGTPSTRNASCLSTSLSTSRYVDWTAKHLRRDS